MGAKIESCCRWGGGFGAFRQRLSSLPLFCAVVVTILTVSAMRANALTVGEFNELMTGLAANDDASRNSVRSFLGGLLDGLAEMNAAYVEEGAKPATCVPRNPHPPLSAIAGAIGEHFERRYDYLVSNPQASVEPLIFHALARKWPCK